MFIRFFVANILVVELYGKKDSSIRCKGNNLLEILNQIDYIRGVVAINNKWEPKTVDKLEFQDKNYRGLFWWYNEVLRDIAETNRQNLNTAP